MKEGSIILTPLPQADGKIKLRPALILRVMPHFNDFLVCGISSKTFHFIKGFDELIIVSDSDFANSGLIQDSIIRLSFLAVLPKKNIVGSIGEVSKKRQKQLLKNLAHYLLKNCNTD